MQNLYSVCQKTANFLAFSCNNLVECQPMFELGHLKRQLLQRDIVKVKSMSVVFGAVTPE